MARSGGCCGGSGSVEIVGGKGIAIEGHGNIASPFVISSDDELARSLEVVDSATVALTLSGGGTKENPFQIKAQIVPGSGGAEATALQGGTGVDITGAGTVGSPYIAKANFGTLDARYLRLKDFGSVRAATRVQQAELTSQFQLVTSPMPALGIRDPGHAVEVRITARSSTGVQYAFRSFYAFITRPIDGAALVRLIAGEGQSIGLADNPISTEAGSPLQVLAFTNANGDALTIQIRSNTSSLWNLRGVIV